MTIHEKERDFSYIISKVLNDRCARHHWSNKAQEKQQELQDTDPKHSTCTIGTFHSHSYARTAHHARRGHGTRNTISQFVGNILATSINYFFPRWTSRRPDDPTRRDKRWATSGARHHAKNALYVALECGRSLRVISLGCVCAQWFELGSCRVTVFTRV